ncbi:bifunctional isochorismate lyase/aryl carrier protein [Saccharothrix tamanrassetensis]|uniref:Bifunctional isochorismate lyase/aryl carrier protein n=1 Tax=Saccharothrix tamanrassetensis TaxID=1051531 RepID=A0A841CTI5_9PSEU|nr:phosphopantetheine-binding protein [Saccharothrix tamanrassetensis]MBB5960609.1 bifunctional isochorismate lyase/aryl carrier protein [Saccharothrix tamanrassetensis]
MNTESRDRVRERIAAQLDIPPEVIADDDNLLDHGLDSVRVMALVESWRADGARVSFADLAESPTVRAWTDLLTR